jgi:hypothetical protein
MVSTPYPIKDKRYCCKTCNKLFIKTTKNKLYCSYKCQRKANYIAYKLNNKERFLHFHWEQNIKQSDNYRTLEALVYGPIEVSSYSNQHLKHKIIPRAIKINFVNNMSRYEHDNYRHSVKNFELAQTDNLTPKDCKFFNMFITDKISKVRIEKSLRNSKVVPNFFRRWMWRKKRRKARLKLFLNLNRIKKFIGTNNEEYTIDMVQLRQEIWEDKSIESQKYLTSNIEADKQ